MLRIHQRLTGPIAVFALTACGLIRAAEPKIVGMKEGDAVALVAENALPCPVTLTLRATGTNLHSSAMLPLTIVVAGDAHERLTLLHAAESGKAWHYNWNWHWEEGSKDARHDDSVVYELPYPSGVERKVGQGFHGKFSHHGEEEYAIDWHMPVGSVVCAARAGRVVRIRMDSNVGGNDLKEFGDKANYIHILHHDGTLGVYMHLQQHGALVKVGDPVKAGEKIGLSGNTGFSTEPHLHFHVAVPNDGKSFHTVPIKFHTKHAAAVVPEQGKSYTAP